MIPHYNTLVGERELMDRTINDIVRELAEGEGEEENERDILFNSN